MNLLTDDIQAHWLAVQPILSIRSEEEYDVAIARMNELLDEVGSDEQHPLYDLLDTLGTVILAYEERHYPIPECTGIDALQFLMEEHELGRTDLPELGTLDALSEILDGKQELTLGQIRLLADRFHVSPATFV